jgi:hypothetical protein
LPLIAAAVQLLPPQTTNAAAVCAGAVPAIDSKQQGPQNLLEGLSSAAGGASAAMERLQRYMTPPPAGVSGRQSSRSRIAVCLSVWLS